jgi:hypothetical protein
METPVVVFVFLLAFLVGLPSWTQESAKPPGSGVSTGVPAPRPETAQPNMQLIKLARESWGISPDQASRLEESLSRDPNDLAARAQLLGYYFATGGRLSPEGLHEARLRHILWLVQNHPESELAGISEATIDPAGGPLADRTGYEKVKALWLEQVKANPDTIMVLANAAWFFKLPDKATAARLLVHLHSIDPGNKSWSTHLGMVYAGAIVGLTGMNQNRFATAADPEEARGPFAQQAREELSRSKDAQVVGTAGYYLWFWGGVLNSLGKTTSDYSELAEKYLTGAKALDPGNVEWPKDLANLYELRAMKAKTLEERSTMLGKKLSPELADLAQAIPQRNTPLATGEKVAPPNGFSVEKLPKSAQDAARAGVMRINENAEVQVYIDMPAPVWGSYLSQLSSFGATPQRIVLAKPNSTKEQFQTVQAWLPITMINQVAMLPFVRYIRLPD